MGMTMTQKILAKHAGLDSVTAGQLIEANVDLTLANDITGPVAIREMEKAGFEQGVRQHQDCAGNGPLRTEQGHQVRRAVSASAASFRKKYNIVNFFDVGAMGIEHALLPEKGLTAPGELHHRRGQPHLHLRRAGRVLDRRRFHRPRGRHGDRQGVVQGAERDQVRAHRQAEPVGIRQGRDPAHHRQDRRGRRAVQVDGVRRRGRRTRCPWTTASPSATWRSRPVRRTASSRWTTRRWTT